MGINRASEKPVILYNGMEGTVEVFIRIHKHLFENGYVSSTVGFLTNDWYGWRSIRRYLKGLDVNLLLFPTTIDFFFSREPLDVLRCRVSGFVEDEFVKAWRNDRTLWQKLKYSTALRFYLLTCLRIEKFIQRIKPDFVFTEVIQSMSCQAFYFVCKKHGIPYLQINAARLPENRIEIHSDDRGWPTFFSSPDENLDEIQRATERRLESSNKTPAPGYSSFFSKNRQEIRFDHVVKGIKFLSRYFFGGGILNVTRVGPFSPFVSKFKATLASHKSDFELSYFKTLKSIEGNGKKKLLFPMHVTPEATTLTWANRYSNMLEVIQNLSENLPDGWELVVRSHPMISSGLLPRTTTKAIASLPNVVFLPGSIPSQQILEVVDRVVVVNGTFGFEQMLENKVVITLGKPFYDWTGNTIPIESYAELANALEWAEKHVIHPEKNKQLIMSYYRATGPGIFGNPEILKKENGNLILSDRNVIQVAEYLKRVMDAQKIGHFRKTPSNGRVQVEHLVRHIGIVVNDLDKASRLFREGFDATIVYSELEKGTYLDALYESKDVRAQIQKIKIPGNPFLIELLCFENEQIERPKSLFRTGCHHLAVTVQDIASQMKKMTDLGCRFHSMIPLESPDGKVFLNYGSGPDEIIFELVQQR